MVFFENATCAKCGDIRGYLPDLEAMRLGSRYAALKLPMEADLFVSRIKSVMRTEPGNVLSFAALDTRLGITSPVAD